MVSFHYLDLETNYDYLYVGRGVNRTDKETLVAKLTGNAGPNSLSVTADFMWLLFDSDRGVAETGFFLQIAWSAVPGKALF